MSYAFIIGLITIFISGFAIVWSIVMPTKRIWPLEHLTPLKFILIWTVTFLAYGSMVIVCILDWNSFNAPAFLRYGTGLPLLFIGHIIVWLGVKDLGIKATSGAPRGLKTDGIYARSRNPQYTADIVSLVGWAVLCSSLWALPLIAGIALVFAITPFAEEIWLREKYRGVYTRYCEKVRRYI